MGWFSNFFSSQKNTSLTNVPTSSNGMLLPRFNIPEPTRSLLWITNENPAKIQHAGSITMTITLRPDGVTSETDHHKNIFAEPSLIWVKLPYKENKDLETEAMYFPSYSTLSPIHRFQYLKWLEDITQPTNLSYVFLYYYGLERHLLQGNYELALAEIARLMKHHVKGSFLYYTQGALITTALHKKNFELFTKHPELLSLITNESLLIRKLMGKSITSKEIMSMASHVKFYNKRYMKLYPELFEQELEKLLIEHEFKYGSILDVIPENELTMEEEAPYANRSLNVTPVKTPQLYRNEKFIAKLHAMLEEAHEGVREVRGRKKQS